MYASGTRAVVNGYALIRGNSMLAPVRHAAVAKARFTFRSISPKRNSKRRIALDVPDRRALRILSRQLRSMCPTRFSL
jgi:hypothetical protein